MKERSYTDAVSAEGDQIDTEKQSVDFSVFNQVSKGFNVNLVKNSLIAKLRQHRSDPESWKHVDNFGHKLPRLHSQPHKTSARNVTDSKSTVYCSNVDSAKYPEPASVRTGNSKLVPVSSFFKKSIEQSFCNTGAELTYNISTQNRHFINRSANGNDCTDVMVKKVIKPDEFVKPRDKYAVKCQEVRHLKNDIAHHSCEFQLDEGNSHLNMIKSLEDSDRKHKNLSCCFPGETGLNLTKGKSQMIVSNRPSVQDNKEFNTSAGKPPHQCHNQASERNFLSSIGVRWTTPTVSEKETESIEIMPTVAQNETARTESIKTPIWSWLVTYETQPQIHKRKKGAGRCVLTALHSSNNISANNTRRYRVQDVHPVTTAMNREGISMSRTKWEVPRLYSSVLDTERALLERVDLVTSDKFDLFQEKAIRSRNRTT